MIILLYSLFAALSGLIEAVLYSRRGAEAFTRNEHIEMSLQRLTVLLLAPAGIACRWLGMPLSYIAAEHVAAVLMFPMVHDEAYNLARLWIREAEKAGTAAGAVIGAFPGWLLRWLPTQSHDGRAFCRVLHLYQYGYQSPTTTARNDFNGLQRSLMAAAGVIVWALTLIIINL